MDKMDKIYVKIRKLASDMPSLTSQDLGLCFLISNYFPALTFLFLYFHMALLGQMHC